MQPKSIKDVNERVKGFYEKAQQATRQDNYDYAIEMYLTALKNTPEFRDARLELRKVELEKIGNKINSTRQGWIATKNALALNMKGPGLIKKGDYLGAMDIAEGILAQDPTVPGALKLLANAAEEGGFDWLAIDTLEFYSKIHTKDTAVLRTLVDLYLVNNRGEDAIKVCQKMQKLEPNNGEIQSLMKNAMARSAMDKSSWMADNQAQPAGTATSQTKTNAPGKSQEVAAGDKDDNKELIRKYEEVISQGNDSADIRKKLARNYLKENMFDQAIEQLDICMAQGASNDPQVQTMMFQAVDGRFENAIKAWTEYSARGEAENNHAAQEIAKLEQQRSDYKLLRARERVMIYSNDPNVHMELALLLWERQELEEALIEFNKSQGSPRYRKKATLLKGKCLSLLGNHDEAVNEFELLISELSEMNADKQEAYYELAIALLQLGDQEKAADYLKALQQSAPGYRDVQEILDSLNS